LTAELGSPRAEPTRISSTVPLSCRRHRLHADTRKRCSDRAPIRTFVDEAGAVALATAVSKAAWILPGCDKGLDLAERIPQSVTSTTDLTTRRSHLSGRLGLGTVPGSARPTSSVHRTGGSGASRRALPSNRFFSLLIHLRRSSRESVPTTHGWNSRCGEHTLIVS